MKSEVSCVAEATPPESELFLMTPCWRQSRRQLLLLVFLLFFLLLLLLFVLVAVVVDVFLALSAVPPRG